MIRVRRHAQNLNEKGAGIVGSIVRHGRGWMDLFKGEYERRQLASFGVEWHLGLGVRATHAGIKVMGEDYDLCLGAGVHSLFSLYLRARVCSEEERHRLSGICEELQSALYGGHGFTVFNVYGALEHVMIDVWRPNMHNTRVPRSWSIWPLEAVFGSRENLTTEIVHVHKFEAPLPEGPEPVSVVVYRHVVKRERLPFRYVRAFCRVRASEVVPGDQGVLSTTTRGGDVYKALGEFVAEVIRDRGHTRAIERVDGGLRALRQSVDG